MTATRTVDKEVVDIEDIESCEMSKLHVVPLIGYKGKCTEGLQKMGTQFDVENEGIGVPTQVRWLANSCTTRERRQNAEISVSSVVLVVTGSNVVHRLGNTGIKAAGKWYWVETYRNAGSDSQYYLCCGYGDIERKCTNNPTCGNC